MRRHSGHGCGKSGFDIPEAILGMAMGGFPPGLPPFPPGGFGPGGFGSGDWGRDPRRRRQFDSGELKLVLLKLIADAPRHGYDLIRAVEELTHGSYAPSPGVVYPTLTLLQDMGLIEEAESAGSRKAFAATAEGQALLAGKAEEVERLLARLAGLGEGRRRAGGGPVGRAVKNLLSALWSRATSDDADEERLHQIAAILDETAQRIERLK
jgi:DNA-binding PadR family transcriptional regulator